MEYINKKELINIIDNYIKCFIAIYYEHDEYDENRPLYESKLALLEEFKNYLSRKDKYYKYPVKIKRLDEISIDLDEILRDNQLFTDALVRRLSELNSQKDKNHNSFINLRESDDNPHDLIISGQIQPHTFLVENNNQLLKENYKLLTKIRELIKLDFIYEVGAYEYSDFTSVILTHETEYSEEEFKVLVKKARNIIKNDDGVYLDNVINALINYFGFKRPDYPYVYIGSDIGDKIE